MPPDPAATPQRGPKVPDQQSMLFSSVLYTWRMLSASYLTAVSVERPSDPERESAPWKISVTRAAKIPSEGRSRPVLTKRAWKTREETPQENPKANWRHNGLLSGCPLSHLTGQRSDLLPDRLKRGRGRILSAGQRQCCSSDSGINWEQNRRPRVRHTNGAQRRQ